MLYFSHLWAPKWYRKGIQNYKTKTPTPRETKKTETHLARHDDPNGAGEFVFLGIVLGQFYYVPYYHMIPCYMSVYQVYNQPINRILNRWQENRSSNRLLNQSIGGLFNRWIARSINCPMDLELNFHRVPDFRGLVPDFMAFILNRKLLLRRPKECLRNKMSHQCKNRKTTCRAMPGQTNKRRICRPTKIKVF